MDGDQAPGPRRAVADRLRHVEQAVAAIGTTLDARTTAGELATFLTKELCASATVELVASSERRRARSQALRPAAAAGRRDLLDRLATVPYEDVVIRSLDTGQPITASLTPGTGPTLVVLSVPLPAQGRVYGVVVALRTGRPFTDDETAAIHLTAQLAATHLRHAEEYQEVSTRMWDLQQALLADPGRPHPNVDLATRYLPAGRSALVGGDWCETVRLHFGRTLLVIGDVMGHGLDAAVDMNAYRSMLRYIASADLPPHRILRRVDAAMSEDSGRRPATCLLALLDPARGTVGFASAGHLPPAVFHRDGTAELIPVPVGPPLGTGLGDYEMAGLPLAPDDTLMLFTDGLVERRDEDIDTSLARLAALQVHPGRSVSGLLDEILGRLGAHQAEDDVAAVAARLRPRADDESAQPV